MCLPLLLVLACAERLAEGPAFMHSSPKKTENGRSLVPGGYYITVRYYERFPPSSPSAFKLTDTKWTENAEGVIARRVIFSRPQVRRSARAGLSDRNPPKFIMLSQVEKLDCMRNQVWIDSL